MSQDRYGLETHARRRSRRIRRLRENLVGYSFIAPAVGLFLAIGLFTVVFSVVLSFFQWKGVDFKLMVYRGVTYNFRRFLFGFEDPFLPPAVARAVWHNIQMLVGLVVTIPLSLVIAVALRRVRRFQTAFRTIYFLPMVASGVAIYYMWMGVLAPDGLINNWLRALGLGGLAAKNGWLAQPNTALWTLVGTGIWSALPGAMILYYAGLQTVDNDLYEAAEVDGASKWQQLLHVTWPMLRPMTVILVVNGLANMFSAFEHVWVMTQGGPAGSTEVIGTMLYQMAFYGFSGYQGRLDLGLAAAISWFLFLFTFGFSIISVRYLQRDWIGDK
ncbi:MAG: carbohydrate ABC transporter permease [Bacteroidota bacterium]